MKVSHLFSRLGAVSTFVVAASLTVAAAPAADVTGVWFNDTGRGAIEIKPCGGALCGHVVWVKDGSDAKGCGRQIIGDAQEGRGGTWSSGWIYSPERKRRYDVELKALDQDRLRVVGFAGSKFFSKTMIWKRAPNDLQRCGETVATEPVAETASEPVAPPTATIKPSQPAAVAPAETESPESRLRSELNKTEDPTNTAGAGTGTAEAEQGSDDETADAGDAGLGDVGLGNLKLDRYLKRKDGKCDLDLPWVKVSFDCEK